MKHIILVEDDPAIRDSLSVLFESMDIKLSVYPNGETILAGEYVLPDLFLLDKQLSGVDGLDICRYIKKKENTKNIPVVMISANPCVVQLASAAGADEVIIKPYKLADIRKITSKYL
jgi:DNA-binding response OmpR family regulator